MFTNQKHEEAHETLKKGEIDKAILLYTEALQNAENDCNIISDRAVAYLHKQDKLRSIADFDKAVQLEPDYAYRYAARAFAKQNFGDTDGAVEDYKKAIELDPNDSVAHNNLGLLLEQQGYQKEAQERFDRADKLSKAEDKLYEMMDEMESGEDKPPQSKQEPKVEINQEVKTTLDQEDQNSTKSEELKKIFTSRKQFKEFVQFVRSGFKLK